jgi:hypothetical protein
MLIALLVSGQQRQIYQSTSAVPVQYCTVATGATGYCTVLYCTRVQCSVQYSTAVLV